VPTDGSDRVKWLAVLENLPVKAQMSSVCFAPGEPLIVEGDSGDFFLIVSEGEVDVYRSGELMAAAGPGSVVGELSLLTGARRTTTVNARTTVTACRGSAEDFAQLLESDAIRQHFTGLAAARLAANASAVQFTTASGFRGEIRPLLPTDRNAYVTLLDKLSPQSRRLRFFSPAVLTDRLIDYLVDIDFINHFAWVVLDQSTTPPQGCAIARFIRSETDVHRAEAAFAVIDALQGKGIGTVMLGALGVAASSVGVSTFTAEVLDENSAMRRVFQKADATWERIDRDVTQATMSVDVVRTLLNPELDASLGESVYGIGLAAEIGLRM
jgi:protein lysine acetyltransferase